VCIVVDVVCQHPQELVAPPSIGSASQPLRIERSEAPAHSAEGALVLPKSSVAMMDFLNQHYSEEELTGVFQPTWNWLARKHENKDELLSEGPFELQPAMSRSSSRPFEARQKSTGTNGGDDGGDGGGGDGGDGGGGDGGGGDGDDDGGGQMAMVDEYLEDCVKLGPSRMRVVDTHEITAAITSVVEKLLVREGASRGVGGSEAFVAR
jgi:hypothetical protein